MTLTENDGNVNVLPINGTRRPGKAYVSLFFLKCSTGVPVLEAENQGPAGTYILGGKNVGNSIEMLLKSKGKADTLPRQGD